MQNLHIWESVKTQGGISMNTVFYNKIKKFLYSKDLKIIEYERSPRAIHIEKNTKKTYEEATHGEIYSLRWGEYDCLKIDYYYKDKPRKTLSILRKELGLKYHKKDVKFLDIMGRFYKKYKSLIENNSEVEIIK